MERNIALLCLVSVLLLIIPFSASSVQVASYLKSQSGGYDVVPMIDQNAVAYAIYEDTVTDNGWKRLEIVAGYSSTHYNDSELLYAAGILEGYLTQKDIFNMYTSLFKEELSSYGAGQLQKVKEFYLSQREWTHQMINQNARSSESWYYTSLLMQQFSGMVEGYSITAPQDEQLEMFAFDFLSGNGDFLDIRNYLLPEMRPDLDKLSKEEIILMLQKGHCSALIKVLPGFENIFAAHSSWYTYVAMNRIFKHYSFKTANSFSQPPTRNMSFSSYPGYLSSLDDFYIMDSGLVMLQTTNAIFNKELYNLSTPKALLAWHRVRLANWLASGGKEWAEIVSSDNSGTYNNQYMVLDLSKVELNKAINDDALWIVEQIPGYVKSSDETSVLRAGYWPSYNVPFFEDIFQMSGYAAAEAKLGTEMSYELCPRAKIFR